MVNTAYRVLLAKTETRLRAPLPKVLTTQADQRDERVNKTGSRQAKPAVWLTELRAIGAPLSPTWSRHRLLELFEPSFVLFPNIFGFSPQAFSMPRLASAIQLSVRSWIQRASCVQLSSRLLQVRYRNRICKKLSVSCSINMALSHSSYSFV